jgi:hypothetical protein
MVIALDAAKEKQSEAARLLDMGRVTLQDNFAIDRGVRGLSKGPGSGR